MNPNGRQAKGGHFNKRLSPANLHPFTEIRENFDTLRASLLGQIRQHEQARQQLWSNSPEGKISHELSDALPVFFDSRALGLVFFCFLIWADWVPYLLLLIVGMWVLNGLLRAVFQLRSKATWGKMNSDISYYRDQLHRGELDFSRQWERACDDFVGYPPDWEDRRKRVLERDHNRCAKCGATPQENVLELHVHHIKSIAQGGNNAMPNLITLCHICHRNVDLTHRDVRPSWEFNRTRSEH